MNNAAYAGLDQAELLQLALNAGAQGDAGAAIAYLKEAVGRPDATAVAHLLLGAEYAQNQLYDRAVDEMEAAIALDPTLSVARFQLGLLLTCLNEAGRAELVLTPLLELGADDPLHRFGAGVLALIGDRLADAVDELERGIELNAQNAPLNADMRRLADEVRKAIDVAAPPAPADEADDAPSGGLHVLLSAYMGNAGS